MKKIGLIGGMSWESSLVYYKILNEKVRELLGGFHSCNCVMESVDFAEVEKLQYRNDWDSMNDMMVRCANNLEKAGAEIIILCTNTMHLCSEAITQNISVPFLHIADATAIKIQESRIEKVLLLGTKFTMESDFYNEILQNKFRIELITPNKEDRALVHQVIYKELVQGIINDDSRVAYQNIIGKAVQKGAQGVVLGCTEIPLLIKAEDVSVPVFDTTRIHAESAVEFALQ